MKPTDLQPAITPLRPREENAPSEATGRMQQVLRQECAVMVHYALDEGRAIPADLTQRIAQVLAAPAAMTADASAAQLTELIILHGTLSPIIAPARGRTLVLLEEERKAHPTLYVFGPVRLVRQMLGFAIVALFATCVLSTIKYVNVDNVANGWFLLNGWEAVCVLGFLLSVAALGSAFSALSIISRYIEQANYDPTFEGSYWVRVVLGLISGVVLGEILFDLVIKSDSASGIAPAGERIVLAFLGGFATAPVQRLLTNLSDAIGTLLQGRNQPPPVVTEQRATPAEGQNRDERKRVN